MKDNDTALLLQRLGFGDYEARAYIGLLRNGEITGYELAKVSGVPRANVYEVLPRLEARGAVVRVDSPSGARYSAVPTSQLMPRLADRFNDDLAAAEEALLDKGPVANQDYSWNVEGYRPVIDHARTLVDDAENELLLAVWPQEARALAASVSAAEARGVPVTTLCLAGCARECGNCHGNIYRYRLSPEEGSRWLVVGADGKEMLAGEIDNDPADDEAYAIRTTHRMLVEFGGWYVRNSIALATLVSDLGDRLPGILSPHAAQVLSSLKRGGLAAGWLEQMRDALHRPPTTPPGKEVTNIND
ncbi:MAG: TrmB family transcriptional regulator [Chloroflexia bacterium]